MPDLTPEAKHMLADAAQRHGFSAEAALAVLPSLAAHGGTMAQFSHPELGGMGQWSAGGMVMVGDMFNQDLKRRVDALCSELALTLERIGPADHLAGPAQAQAQSQRQQGGDASNVGAAGWWPAELGTPASSGAQDSIGYAYFPDTRRLAIQHEGRVNLYDTADHRIYGVSQQQGNGVRGPTFSSDKGQVRLADLDPVDPLAPTLSGPRPVASAEPSSVPAQAQPPQAGDIALNAASSGPVPGDPITLIERLAELHRKGILTEAEFAAKKAELLSRL